jgi:hypothetical protein
MIEDHRRSCHSAMQGQSKYHLPQPNESVAAISPGRWIVVGLQRVLLPTMKLAREGMGGGKYWK